MTVGLGPINQGFSHNFFQRLTVSNATFNNQPDVILNIRGVPSVSIINEGSGTVVYSWNGSATHGDMVAGTPSSRLVFNHHGGNQLWFKLSSGAASSVRVEATSDGDLEIGSFTNAVSISTGTLPGAVALGDAVANPTTTIIGAFNEYWDGTVWVRGTAGVVSPSGTPTGMQNVLPMAQYQGAGTVSVASGQVSPLQSDSLSNLNTTLFTALAGEDLTNNVMATIIKPLAVNTYTPSAFQNLGANATLNVKSTAGIVLSLTCINKTASVRYICLYNSATTASGAPLEQFLLPGNSCIVIGTDYFTLAGKYFSTGIAFGVSTTVDTYTAASATDHSTQISYL